MRRWDESVATLAELVPGGVATLTLIMLALAAIVTALLLWWPARQPGPDRSAGRRCRWRWRLSRPRWGRWRAWLRGGRWRAWLRWVRRVRWRRPRWWPPRWRRRGRSTEPQPPPLDPDELPDLPAGLIIFSADQLAAAGRYREAVLERLRAIVRDLVDHGVVSAAPGLTVAELARAAAGPRADLAPALNSAGAVFSEIWYGQRPASADDDATMRAHAQVVHAALGQPAPWHVTPITIPETGAKAEEKTEAEASR